MMGPSWFDTPRRGETSHILVIEDDDVSAAEIMAVLADGGLEGTRVSNGPEGVLAARGGEFDAVILDRMLPGGLEGLSVLGSLRAMEVQIPVLILSALGDVEERVRGLRAGGDDYLVKPFNSVELLARVDALLRRSASDPASLLKISDICMDRVQRTVTRAGKRLDLLPREFELLAYLMTHAGRIVTRAMMFETVWGYRYDERANLIDVHIAKLRRKLEADDGEPMIHTVRGVGYVLRTAG